jgi:hypothetical protein
LRFRRSRRGGSRCCIRRGRIRRGLVLRVDERLRLLRGSGCFQLRGRVIRRGDKLRLFIQLFETGRLVGIGIRFRRASLIQGGAMRSNAVKSGRAIASKRTVMWLDPGNTAYGTFFGQSNTMREKFE